MRDDAPMVAYMGYHEPFVSVRDALRVLGGKIRIVVPWVFEVSDGEKDVTEDLVGKPHNGPFRIVGAARQYVRMLAA